MLAKEVSAQRLFSTFAGGWPGVGLLLQRLFIGTVLFHQGLTHLSDAGASAAIVPQLVGAFGGAFLLVGLWTPVAGIVVAIAGGWLVWSNTSNPVPSIMLSVLGITLAMIGPGAFSIDAHLFGRKHIEPSEL